METMSAMAPEASESSSDLAARINLIAQALLENGHSLEEAEVAMKIEYVKVQLAEEWQEEGRTTDSRESIQDWAARRLVGLKPGDESAEDFEVKFRALGSWAKIPYMLLTHYLKMARAEAARVEMESGSAQRVDDGVEGRRGSHDLVDQFAVRAVVATDFDR